MFAKILLAVDAAGFSAGVVPVVARLARTFQSEVAVVHVRDLHDLARSRDDARELVDVVAGELAACGVPATRDVRTTSGDPARAISEAAFDEDADLIALGSHGRSELAALVFGSVGQRVSAMVPRSVLVVRPQHEPASFELGRVAPLEKVMVAVRGDESGLAEAAGRLAMRAGARLKILHVQEPPVIAETAIVVESAAEARAAIRSAIDSARSAGATPEAEIRIGVHRVPRQIVAAADEWDADLVILGSRRPSRLSALVLGSCGYEVVRLTRRPVLLAEPAAVLATTPS